MGDAADGDLLFGHHLEQCRLHLGRRPVDLVGEQKVDEHRSEFHVEGLAAPSVDARPGDVGRQQIGRELDAGERAADHVGQGLGRQGLRQARDRLEQTVAPTQHPDE